MAVRAPLALTIPRAAALGLAARLRGFQALADSLCWRAAAAGQEPGKQRLRIMGRVVWAGMAVLPRGLPPGQRLAPDRERELLVLLGLLGRLGCQAAAAVAAGLAQQRLVQEGTADFPAAARVVAALRSLPAQQPQAERAGPVS